jgi:hypothetical protein
LEIYRIGNGGDGAIHAGSLKRANSFNVAPTTLVATASTGTTMDVNSHKNYEWYNVAQTSAGTDFITLPASPIGTVFVFYAISACKVQGTASDTINGVAPSTDITLPAGSRSEIVRNTATTWTLTQYSAAGAVTAPIA